MAKRVFLSRKESDRDAIAAVRDLLDTYTGDAVDFVSADNLPPGVKWRSWLEEQLRKADLLLVFATHPSDRWDWLLYEAGWYTRLGEQGPPLICFHADDCPPGPLEDFQCVLSSDTSKVKEFLRSFYGASDIKGFEDPVNSTVAASDEKLSEIAREFCDIVAAVTAAKKPITQFQYNRYIELSYTPAAATGSLPADASVSADKSSLNIFGLDSETQPDGSAWTWADLVAQVVNLSDRDDKPRWLADLEKAVGCAVAGKTLEPIAGLLQSVSSAKVYRPNVARVDRFCDGSTTVKVLFIHEPIVFTEESMPESPAKTMRLPEADVTHAVKVGS